MGCSNSKSPSQIHTAAKDAIMDFQHSEAQPDITFEICSPNPNGTEPDSTQTSNPKSLSFGCVDTIGKAFAGVPGGAEGDPMLEYGVRTVLPGLKKLRASKKKTSQIAAEESEEAELEADRVLLITAGMSYVVYGEGVYPTEGIVIACKTVPKDGTARDGDANVDGMLVLRYFPKGFKYTNGSFTEGFRWPMRWMKTPELKWCHGNDTPFGGMSGNKVQTEFVRRGDVQMKLLNKELKEDQSNVGCWDMSPSSGGVLFLVAVAVNPSKQGTGMGGKLMKLTCAIADRLGAEKTYLECCPGKRATIYAKYGFRVVKQGKVRDEKGIELMRKDHGVSDYDESDCEAVAMVRDRK